MPQCEYCKKIIDNEHTMCEECEKKATQLLENDEILVNLNNKYIKTGIFKYVSFVLSIFEFFIIYMLLEGNNNGFLGGLIVILFIPTVITFIISTVMRIFQKHKITKTLDEKMS